MFMPRLFFSSQRAAGFIGGYEGLLARSRREKGQSEFLFRKICG